MGEGRKVKQVVYGLCCSLIFFFGVVLYLTISGKFMRQSEILDSLTIAVDSTMERTLEERRKAALFSKELAGEEQWIEEFQSQLKIQLGSKSIVSIDILNADYEKGLLHVRVKEKFKQANGTWGEVVCERIGLIDEKIEGD